MALGFPNPPPYDGYIFTLVGSNKSYRWSAAQAAWLINTAATTATSVVSPKVTVTSATNATSTLTGALIVNGGVGIGGDLYVGGLIYSGGVPALTTSSFNISDGPDGGIDINIAHIYDPQSGLPTIRIDNISTLETVTGREAISSNVIQITNVTSSTSVATGALIVAGGVGISGRVNTESIQIVDAVFDSTNTPVNDLTEYVVDSYLLSQYRSSKYFIQIDEGGDPDSRFQAVEIILTAKNDGTPYMTQYGMVTTDNELGTFSAKGETSGSDILISLTFTATSPLGKNKHIKVLRTAMLS